MSVRLLLDGRIQLSKHACAQANPAHPCSKASVEQFKFERVEKSFFTNWPEMSASLDQLKE